MLNAWKQWKRNNHSGGRLDRVQIGPQLVAGNTTVNQTLEAKNILGGDARLLPFPHRLGRDIELRSDRRPRDNLKDGLKGNVLHIGNYIHRQLTGVNNVLIARPRLMVDHKQMVETPRPEHFGAFKEWLEAVRRARSLTKRGIAEIAHTSPQAVTRWFKGGGVDQDALQYLADWAGTDYAALRLLIEGRQLPSKKGTVAPIVRGADAHRIARKLDLLSLETLHDIEAMVDHQLEKQAKRHQKRG